VNPAAIAAIDQKYALQRAPLENILQTGPKELSQIYTAANQQRITFKQETTRLTEMLVQAKADAGVPNNNQLAIIIGVLLVLGIIIRLGVDRIERPENTHTSIQLIEPAPEIESHSEVSTEDIHRPDSTVSNNPAPQSVELTQNVASNAASREQAKPIADDELVRRGRYPVLTMLSQARLNGGLENEAQIGLTRAEIEALPRPVRGDPETARRLNQEGLMILKKGNTSEAVSRLNLAYAADPSDVEIASNLGYAYLRAGDLHQADAYLIYATGLAPSRSSTWVRLGELFAAKQDLELAESALAHAVRFSDNRVKTRLLLNQLATAAPGTILEQAIHNVVNLPFTGFSGTENPPTLRRSDQ
jgi:hypothetical protein